ncbi:MAG TPA: DUF4293 family protein [Edaphocola sp.]|nr:DUF4293 family protein [Edaphocola sp.]
MIQRIQSIWLLLAAISISALFYVDVYSVTIPSILSMPTEIINDHLSVASIKNNILEVALTSLSLILSLVAIFFYKNHKRQKSLIWLNILLLIGLMFLLYVNLNKFWNAYPDNGGHIWIGLFLPVITVFLLILALRAIKKDEKLLKSLDRMR